MSHSYAAALTDLVCVSMKIVDDDQDDARRHGSHVHPADERYRELVERKAKVRLPITGREIPIIADDHADPELGSGAGRRSCCIMWPPTPSPLHLLIKS